MRILLIDDDADAGTALGAALSAHPEFAAAEIEQAVDDRAALALMQGDHAYDLALVSIDGGAVSGLALFKQLMEPSLRIPRLALTDGSDLQRVRGAVADGAADLLIKPLASADVGDALARVMARVARRRRNWHERAEYMALRREVDLAAEMQRRILPQQTPRVGALEFASLMRPARGIGGDFYDAFRIDERRVGLVIADVSGKGVPAAFYMAIANTAMRAVAMSGAAPGACLGEVNRFLVGRDIPGMFVSMYYAVIDTAAWSIACANAGHQAPLVCVDGTPHALDTAGGPVLGILDDEAWQESRFDFASGATLVLYTDGVTEAFDGARQQFGEARLMDVAAGAHADCAELIATLDAAVSGFAADTEQHDDITALAVRRVA